MSEATTLDVPTSTPVSVANAALERVRKAVELLALSNLSTFEMERVRSEAREAVSDTQIAQAGLYRLFNDTDRLLDAAKERNRDLQGRLDAKELELEAFKLHATEILHREANNRGYCSEFDDVMADIGLPRRHVDYRVDLTVTLDMSVIVNANSEDDAKAGVSHDDVVARLYDMARHQLSESVMDYDSTDASIDE